MLEIEIDMDKPGVSEHIHELLSRMTETIVTGLEHGETTGPVYELDGSTVGKWTWE